MFGLTYRIEYDGFGVTLRAFTKDELRAIAPMFSRALIQRYTLGFSANTAEDEEEYFNKNRENDKTITWAIVPDGNDEPVGSTAIHGIDVHGKCTSGIIIYDDKWWGKGVATRAHLIRTWVAANHAKRLIIKSHVYAENTASWRALARVGYIKTGESYGYFHEGVYKVVYDFTWFNPRYVHEIFPNGLPEEFKEGVDLAKLALEKAKKHIQLV